ncbi:hypothetical protein [Corynebacterium stationis]|uniref:Uncharacterized protein n=1 Tax=Corynebacterium stationis TaxID=1705 RepID=A0AB36CKW0_9CORY|nr:hypothetical protein [Corynebacterium stationis]NME89545.1 hypothetical protein [Corynebacterium stationis]
MSALVKNLRSTAVDAVAKQVAATPHVQHYKGSYLIVATGVAAGLGGIVPYLAGAPWWVAVIVTTVATFCTMLANRLTKDGFTPSMVDRIGEVVPDIDVEPVPKDYEGKHRAPTRFSLYE